MPQTSTRLGGSERPFVGREDLKAAFDAAFDGLGADANGVLMFYGVGGIGKSALIRELRRRMDVGRPFVAHARVDFTDRENRIPTTALARSRSALHKQGLPFPTFDIAFAHWWALAYPHQPLSESEIPLLTEGEMVADLIDAAKEVPGVGLISKVPRALHKTGKAFTNWWTKRGSEHLKHIAGLDDSAEVAAWLPAFWAADVRAWQAETGRRAVLFLDTLEALGEAERSGVRGTFPDDWVREWAAALKGVLVVIAGRQRLRWEDRDASWAGEIEQHLIGSLAPEDADEFLLTAGMAEDDVRASVIAKSEGVPLYLDLAMDRYEQIRQSEGRAPRPDEFDANLPALLDRFLHYLSDEQRATILKLAVPSSFDLDRYRDLVQTFGTGYPATADGLARLREFSFVEEPEPRRYALHDLVREAIAAADAADPDREDEREAVLRHLLAQAEAVLAAVDIRAVTEEDERALREATEYQRTLLSFGNWITWYWQAEKPFDTAARWGLLKPLSEFVLGETETLLGPEHPDTLASANNLAYVLYKSGDLKGAEVLHRRVLSGCETVLGSRHPNTLASVHNVAFMLRQMGEIGSAEPLARRALEGREVALGHNHPATLVSANNLAYLLYLQEGYDEAESLYRRALNGLTDELGVEHPQTLTTMNDLALLLKAIRRPGRRREAALRDVGDQRGRSGAR